MMSKYLHMTTKILKKSVLVILYTGFLGGAAMIICLGLLHLITGNFFIEKSTISSSAYRINNIFFHVHTFSSDLIVFVPMFGKSNTEITESSNMKRDILILTALILFLIISGMTLSKFVPFLMATPLCFMYIHFRFGGDRNISNALS